MTHSLSYWTRLAAIAGAVLALPATVSATPTGSIALSAPSGGNADPVQDLATATSVSISTDPIPIYTGHGTGDMSGVVAGNIADFSNLTWNVTKTGILGSITPFTITVGPGTFTFDEQKVTADTHSGIGAAESATLSMTFLGNVSGSVTPDPDTASATLTWNQTGGPGAAISWEGTLAHPQQLVNPVPEPGGIAVLRVSLATLGLVRRRRA